MNKNILFGLLSVTIFLLTAVGGAFGVQRVNQKRLDLVKYYDSVAASSKNPDEAVSFLIKSDTLSPKSQKKVAIALYFLQKGETDKAERYLLFAPNESGNILLSEYYLLNKPEIAQKYLDRLVDSPAKDELTAYSAILNGKTDIKGNFTKPQTDLAKLILAINTHDYSTLNSSPLLVKVNSAIGDKANKYNQTLNLAKFFIDNNQPYLAIYALDSLQTQTGNLPVIYVLKAQALDTLKSKESIGQIAKAIELEPENQNLYVVGINYARKYNDSSKADFWAARLAELQALQK
jgi:hypothetical protein